ncbi:wall-associated receptor kinase 2-like [Carex rostrata]
MQRAMISIQLFLLLLLQFKSTESTNTFMTKEPGCPESCDGSDILIPYPFGIGPNCSLSEEFVVNCEFTTSGNLSPTRGSFLIENISLPLGQARTLGGVASTCDGVKTTTNLSNNAPFRLNTEKNKFTVTGCNTLAYLHLDPSSDYSVGCFSSCDSQDTLNKHGSCSGIGCCQTDIPKGTSIFYATFDERFNNSKVQNFSPCSYAMVVEASEYQFSPYDITNEKLANRLMPIVLDWAIGNTTCENAQTNKSSYACRSDHSICLNSSSGGYFCNCLDGYEGNPYLDEGCQDIDECADQNPCSKQGKCHNLQGTYRCSCPFGLRKNDGEQECHLNVAIVIGTGVVIVVLSFLGFGIYVLLEKRNLSKVKENYFQLHGGRILLEKIKSKQGFGFTIFTKQQIEQITNNFDGANIIGHGGQGTVYKGTQRDQTIAIKKCKIIDESKKKEFGKEMLILSQINHKNIVRILGCCLEVEVPILVYEFIPNGTLYSCIHHKKQGSHISLVTRVRIAHESAEALAYLHTSASPPIYHGDVKSANILLDQNYMAKVSDFGASILAPTDDAQLVTLVQGTLGYLDPEYMQSCKLTDKSDVYSFGVVLLELLTSKPVIDYDLPEEKRSLSSCFLSAMKENKIQELLDDGIIHEDDMELIKAVAELAKKCLSMKGEERPMMKEVAEELHRIRKFQVLKLMFLI